MWSNVGKTKVVSTISAYRVTTPLIQHINNYLYSYLSFLTVKLFVVHCTCSRPLPLSRRFSAVNQLFSDSLNSFGSSSSFIECFYTTSDFYCIWHLSKFLLFNSNRNFLIYPISFQLFKVRKYLAWMFFKEFFDSWESNFCSFYLRVAVISGADARESLLGFNKKIVTFQKAKRLLQYFFKG